MESLYQHLADALANLIVITGGLVLARLLGWFKPKVKPTVPIQDANASTREQKDMLRQLLGELGAMRCYLTKIHNGDHYVDGSEILRSSRVVEVARAGVTFESERFKNLLLSTLLEEQECVEEPGPGWFVTSRLAPSTFRYLNEQTATRAGARVAVKKNGEIVGFLGVDFDTEVKPERLDRIVDYARWLERMLSSPSATPTHSSSRQCRTHPSLTTQRPPQGSPTSIAASAASSLAPKG